MPTLLWCVWALSRHSTTSVFWPLQWRLCIVCDPLFWPVRYWLFGPMMTNSWYSVKWYYQWRGYYDYSTDRYEEDTISDTYCVKPWRYCLAIYLFCINISMTCYSAIIVLFPICYSWRYSMIIDYWYCYWPVLWWLLLWWCIAMTITWPEGRYGRRSDWLSGITTMDQYKLLW